MNWLLKEHRFGRLKGGVQRKNVSNLSHAPLRLYGSSHLHLALLLLVLLWEKSLLC